MDEQTTAPANPQSGPEPGESGLSGQEGQGAAADLQAFPFLQGARLDRLRQDVDAWRTKHGRPVDPPRRPGAISKDHHNPYLLNYANEPLPLRLVDKAGKPNKNEAGDLAFVFSSEVDGRGDPATELLQAYENERIQLRLIQGAQEVQHVAQVQGLRWRREAGDPSSPFVGAQEIGISEHFEIGVDRLPVVQTSTAPEGERDDLPFTDHLYSAGTLDALWNGAWGLLRVHDTPAETDQGVPVAMVDEVRAVNLKLAGEAAIAVHKSKVSQAEQQSANEGQYLGAVVATELKSNSLLPRSPKQADIVVDAITSLGAQLSDLAGEAAIKAGDSLFFAIKSKEAIAENRRKKEPKPQENLEPLLLKAEDGGYLACPKSGPTVSFLVEAWSTSDWLRRPVPGAEYAQQGRLADAAGLTFRLLHVERKPLPLAASDEVQRRWRESARTIDHSRGYVPPLVLRANAGECIQVVLRNCLLGEGADKSCRKDGTVAEDQESDRNRAVGDDHHEQGMLPRITPLNSQHLTPSKYLDLQPQLVSWDLARTNGIPVGKNAVKPVAPGSSASFVTVTVVVMVWEWFAGGGVSAHAAANQPNVASGRRWRRVGRGMRAQEYEPGRTGSIGPAWMHENRRGFRGSGAAGESAKAPTAARPEGGGSAGGAGPRAGPGARARRGRGSRGGRGGRRRAAGWRGWAGRRGRGGRRGGRRGAARPGPRGRGDRGRAAAGRRRRGWAWGRGRCSCTRARGARGSGCGRGPIAGPGRGRRGRPGSRRRRGKRLCRLRRLGPRLESQRRSNEQASKTDEYAHALDDAQPCASGNFVDVLRAAVKDGLSVPASQGRAAPDS